VTWFLSFWPDFRGFRFLRVNCLRCYLLIFVLELITVSGLGSDVLFFLKQMECAYKKINVLSHDIQLHIISRLHLLAAAEDIEASHAFEDGH